MSGWLFLCPRHQPRDSLKFMSRGQNFACQFIKRNFALRASGVGGEFLKVDIKCCQYHRRAFVWVRVRHAHIHKCTRLTFAFFNHMPRIGPTLRRIKVFTMDATGAILWILEDTAAITHYGTPIAIFITIHMCGAKFADNRLRFVAAQRDAIPTTGTAIRTVITR